MVDKPTVTLQPSRRAASIAPSMIRKLFNARRPTSINLGLGEPGLSIPLELFDAGVARYRASRQGYTVNAGLVPLRDRIAAHYAYPHVTEAKNVIVTVGLQEALFATLLAIADPGDEVILPEPSFPAYRTVAELVGLTVVSAPRRRDRDFELDVDAVAAAITPRTRAIILNSPSNPTGKIDGEASLRALVAATQQSGVWLISDEIYREFYFDGSPPPSLGYLSDRAIVLGALSKACSFTGFRLGYAMVPDRIAGAVAMVHQFNVTSAPTISQFLALEVFENPHWLASLRPHFAAQRTAMVAAVRSEIRMPYVPPDGGMFVLLDISSLGIPSLSLAERVLENADVITVPGIAFGACCEGFLRLSYGATEHVSDVVEGMRRIGAYFATIRPPL